MHPDVIAEPAVVALPRADAARNSADPAHYTLEIFLEINIKNILARNLYPSSSFVAPISSGSFLSSRKPNLWFNSSFNFCSFERSLKEMNTN